MKITMWAVLIICMIFAGASMTCAAEFKVYPGEKLDEKLTKESEDFAAKAKVTTKPGIYVTKDAFEKVVEFYKGAGKEYIMPGTQKGKGEKLPSGKELKAAFFIFDGEKDLGTSKLWAKIQRPYIGINMSEGPDMTYIIVSKKK